MGIANFDWLAYRSYYPNMTQNLFSEFAPTSKSDWIQQAIKDLKGRDFDQTLTSTLWEKITLQPFYTSEDIPEKVSSKIFHPESEIPGMSARNWSNAVSVYPDFSSSQILEVLQHGADALVLHLHGFEDLTQLLAGVMPEYISIFIRPIGNPIPALKQFFDWADQTGTDPEKIKGGLLWAPSDVVFDWNEPFGLGLEVLEELMEMSEPYPNFKPLTLKTSRYSEAGGDPVQAVVWSMGELIEILDSEQVSVDRLFQSILLEASIGESHFGEIARLRAFREAMSRLAATYDVQIPEEKWELIAQTAQWSKSVLDVHTNLIRQTYEAMAGVLGGANHLWVKPILEDDAGDLEQRIARNVSTILKEESYLDKVMDPTAGSFYIDSLTSTLVDILKKGLMDLVEMGGWQSILEKGLIHESVRSRRQAIQQAYLDGDFSKIGVNKYPASPVLQKNYSLDYFEEKSNELNPTRASYLVELKTLEK